MKFRILPWKHMWHQYVRVVDLPTCNNDTFLTCFHMGSWMLFCHRKINNASTIPLKKEKEKKRGKLHAENPTKNAKL